MVIHPLTDDRRVLPVEKAGELVQAHPDFQLVVSYNPGYQNVMKDLKPSTRQRFVTIDFDFPLPEDEIEIVRHEAGVERGVAASLVKLAERVRRLRDGASSRSPARACWCTRHASLPAAWTCVAHARRRSPARCPTIPICSAPCRR